MSEQGGASPLAFAVIYQWRLREGMEDQFKEGWRRATIALRAQRAGGGSCLHRGRDGTWFAYARWPAEETRAASRALPSIDPEAARMMREATLETLPEVVLDVVDDLLRPG
jgi:hypothetical protein